MPIHKALSAEIIDHSQKKSMNYGLKTQIFNVKRGFTLIELLIVIAILGILVTIAVASFTGAQGKSRDGRRKGDLDAIKKALELAKSDNTAGNYAQCPLAAPSCPLNATSNTANPVLSPSYIRNMPGDPGNFNYVFVPTPSGCTGATGGTPCTAYTINVCLENTNETVGGSVIAVVAATCASLRQWSITNP